MYTIDDIKKIDVQDYYVPRELFTSSRYKNLRIEVKWCYVACLNVLIAKQTNTINNINDVVELLKILANKKVDKEKVEGYFKELEEYNLINVEEKITLNQL